jgi:CubicO group peptidase (beta-lactamase class C family)
MTTEIDRILRQSVVRGDLAAAAAAVVTPRGTWTGAAGQVVAGAPMTPETVVWIASMTKAITAVAALQLVEQARIDLDAPCGQWVPFLGQVPVLDGFADDGSPLLRPAVRPVTLRHLLTHTSGFGYEFADALLARYMAEQGRMGRAAWEQPLLFEPGERWAYGIGVDWVGRLVEAVSGERLDHYLAKAVLVPLAMHDTGFRVNGAGPPLMADVYQRTPDGLVASPFEMSSDPRFISGGAGLYSTVADYLRFVRMILGQGQLDGARVLTPESVRLMAADQLGDLSVTGWRTARPAYSNDVDVLPGMRQGWGLSSLINPETTPEGRSPGSMFWGGLANTYYWVDPTRQVGGVFATQVLPFFDGPALDTFRAVERLTYESL